ncbi:uncharacterized protein E0L32_009850 [Thyridium curvatum]|uniref:Uncharacterized protein n=1 Tax=Thyridium curvatum TaxID=1093900 RepID=A0A507AUS5_9PEZI|nr:uncharacterized protein E0L32_009850 [Thyridium curvatum]TPX08661.1 hypothetical protein E0L32_009850 [Thyridium curvatum]
MEDPWGSPWTAVDPNRDSPSKQQTTSAASDLELSAPAPAFLNAATSQVPKFTANFSPWAEDDGDNGFGDWSSASPAPTSSWNTGWMSSSAAGAEGLSPNPQLTPTPKQDEFAIASPIAWPGSTATSPGLRAKSRSDSTSLFPAHSPDPWAHDLSPHRGATALERKQQGALREPSPVRLDSGTPQDSGIVPNVQDDGKKHADSMHKDKSEETLAKTEAAEAAIEKQAEESHADRTREDDTSAIDRAGIERTSSSRPSSPESVDSQPAGTRQDSPITSIDEEGRARPQLQERKVSSKVQDLVEMYDGLGRRIVHEPRISKSRDVSKSRDESQSRDESKSRNRSDSGRQPSISTEQPSDDGDFGDFEDAASVASEVEDASEESPDVTPKKAIPKQDILSPSTAVSDIEETDTQRTSGADETKTTEEIKRPEPAEFAVDLGLISQLFKLPGQTFPEDPEPATIPDKIITDSFTTISERKTWYRISRLGTLRKHNYGDDENYKRVSWSSSWIHADTIKIVRRWMEEDSITGRPTFKGGAGKGKGNMFGWDSAAEPVSLDKVFAMRKTASPRKKAAHKPEPLPLRSSMSLGRKSNDSSALPGPGKRASLIQPPEPASPFAWASPRTSVALSSPGITQASVALSTATQAGSQGPEGPQGPQGPQLGGTLQSTPIPSNPPKPGQSQPTKDLVQADDDDDWGEMVGSPQDSGPPMGAFDEASKGEEKTGTTAPPVPLGQGQQLSNPRAPGTASSLLEPLPVQQSPLAGTLATSTAPATTVDPWQSADFSLWDTPGTSTAGNIPQPQATKIPEAPKPHAASFPIGLQSPALSSPPLPHPVAAPVAEQHPDDAADALVNRIISNLPDLSYMLR